MGALAGRATHILHQENSHKCTLPQDVDAISLLKAALLICNAPMMALSTPCHKIDTSNAML